MNDILKFNANGININGVHIHGKYKKVGANGFTDPKLPKYTIIINLDTVVTLNVPGLVSRGDYIEIMPNNRYYKHAFKAYSKARIREINSEIKALNKKLDKEPNAARTYQLKINSLERELIRLK